MINANWKELFPPHILDRGEDYACSGNVEDIRIDNDSIKALVRGTGYYKVEITLKDRMPQKMYCSCPYAEGGSYCKHMAAVLFEAEEEESEDYSVEYEESYKAFRGDQKRSIATDIKELLEGLTREELVAFVKELADGSSEIANLLRVRFSHTISSADMRELKREADHIFQSHENRGFIDHHEAFEFQIDISRFLKEKVGELVDNEQYMDAFELSMYIYIKLSSTDMDDDGEIQCISADCYEIWEQIVSSCSDEDKEKIKNWFEEHADDGTVVDYMEDVLQEFRDRELASDDDLRRQMLDLDKKIDAAGDSTQCPTIWSSFSYDQPAVFVRIELMRRLGMNAAEIEAYRYAHRHFTVVREQYIKETEEAGDCKSLIYLLKESKKLDKDQDYKVHSYAMKLASIYHETGDKEKELEERFADFLRYSGGRNLEAFCTLKGLCVKEEWPIYREKMIAVTEERDKRCSFLAEEKMLEQLYMEIFKQPELKYLDKYGFLLAEDHSEEILGFYHGYVQSTAEYVRNRSGYDLLTRYLSRMQRYKGGSDIVRALALKWINEYPTRKVMVQELREFI